MRNGNHSVATAPPLLGLNKPALSPSKRFSWAKKKALVFNGYVTHTPLRYGQRNGVGVHLRHRCLNLFCAIAVHLDHGGGFLSKSVVGTFEA
jgi:hypothetical protein